MCLQETSVFPKSCFKCIIELVTILDQDTVVVYHTVYKWNIHTDDRMYITSVFLSHVYTASILSLSENLIHFEKNSKAQSAKQYLEYKRLSRFVHMERYNDQRTNQRKVVNN